MEQKKVVVYETQQVNELTGENLSTESVFIQDGDLVKGGVQDRIMSNDFIVPPKSGRRPVAAFGFVNFCIGACFLLDEAKIKSEGEDTASRKQASRKTSQ